VLRNLAIAAVVITAVMGVIALLVYRSANTPARTNQVSVESTAPGTSAERAAAELRSIADASRSLMPEGYEGVYLSMPVAELHSTRPQARRNPEMRRRDGLEVWEEDDASGARVMYLVAIGAQRLAQVQFASQLTSTDQLRPHFEAMSHRYGRATGMWDCPETDEAPPLRRFTWRREGASVMEAVLIYGRSIGLTLIVAGNGDIGGALGRSRCHPVARGDEERFPVAQQLRGEQRPLLRMLPPRDGG
jgi:hypothetical protein